MHGWSLSDTGRSSAATPRPDPPADDAPVLDALLGAVRRATPDASSDRLFDAVLETAAGDRSAVVWSRTPDGWLTRVAESGNRLAGPHRIPSAAVLGTMPAVALLMPIVDGEVDRGVLALSQLPGRRPVSNRERQRVGAAIGYLALLLRGSQLDQELRRRIDDAAALSTALAASRERLSTAADVESRRMVGDLITLGGGRLAEIRARVDQLRDQAGGADLSGPAARQSTLVAIAELRGALDHLIERFRAMARGVYPYVLDECGIVDALRELATTLPRPVRIRGALADVGREVESGLYWAVAAVLPALAVGAPTGRPLLVRLSVDGELATVTVTEPETTSTSPVREMLPAVDDRLAALGGAIGAETSGAELVLRAWVPARLTPVVPAMIAAGPAVWPALPHLVVDTDDGTDLVERTRSLLRAAVEVTDEPDRAVLCELLTMLDREAPEALLAGAGGDPAAALAVARRVIDRLGKIIRRDPGGWLGYEYERLRANSHELDERLLLRRIRTGALPLTEPQRHVALRLLDTVSRSIPARLGLPEETDPDQQRRVAIEQISWWRSLAEQAAVDPHEQAAYRQLARSAEGLLTRLPRSPEAQ
ncbi:hypothetical protein ACN27F_02740 [Solwaraspora sp. WMMB335]|uniref:hypothetical protein n=1 Tax=Solwaraspora sp. WMMB335 TaxID=3404118 RepID=UPI003B95B83D